MTPGAVKRGGAGVTIRWTIAPTSLGPLLVAATAKGLCRVSFDEDAAALRARFPKAEITAGGAALAELAARVVASVESPDRDQQDRKSVVQGKSESVRVDLGGSRIIQKNNNYNTMCRLTCSPTHTSSSSPTTKLCY